MRRRFWLPAVLIPLLAVPAAGETPTTRDPKSSREQVEPTVELTIRKQGWRLEPGLVVRCRVESGAEVDWICVDRLTLSLRSTAFMRDTVLVTTADTARAFPVCLDRQEHKDFEYVFSPNRGQGIEWQLSSASHRVVAVDAVVRYALKRAPGDSLRYGVLKRRAEEQSPPSGVILMLGTLCGALLLRLLKAIVDRSLRGFGTRLLQGWVAASILVLLSQASVENFPIALQIRDFPGAVILGLLSSSYLPALVTFLRDGPDAATRGTGGGQS